MTRPAAGLAVGTGRRPPRRRPRLRTGFVVAVLVGAIGPMALVGLWVVRSTQRSAEVLVRERLERTLTDLALEVSLHWGEERRPLLRFAESDAVRQVFASPRGAEAPTPVGGAVPVHGATRPDVPNARDGVPPELEPMWAELDGVVERAVIRDAGGGALLELERDASTAQRPRPAPGAALLSARIPVHAPLTGDRLGTLEAWITVTRIIPGAVFVSGVGGSVFALFDPADGNPLLPLPMEPEAFRADRFDWRGEGWVVSRHRLYDPPLVLALAAPVGAFSEPFERAGRTGLAALLVVGALASLVIGLTSQRLTRPLAALAEGADDVSAGRLERNVPESGPDEVFRVARAFNAMTSSLRRTLDRLSQQEALAAMGEMAASLAHEVRNPLTAIRLDLQRAERRLVSGEPGARELIRRSLEEIERLDRSVSDALRMARADRPASRRLELEEPLGAALHAAAPAFHRAGAELVGGPAAARGVQVEGDAASLKQLLLNLLLNAAEALHPGGRAGVRVEAEEDRVRVAVWDDGPGMPPEVADRVLEPFFSTRPEGTGLGLPIARRIARAHGGDLELETEPGRGTTVTVVLRRALREHGTDARMHGADAPGDHGAGAARDDGAG